MGRRRPLAAEIKNAFIARYWSGVRVAELVKRAVCSECGSRWPHLSITVAVEKAPRVIPDRSREVDG